MKKYSGNYTSKEQLLSEMDIIKRSCETAGKAKRSCAQFALPSPALARVATAPSPSGKALQAGDQHLPLPSVEPEQGWAGELPGSQPAAPEPPTLRRGSGTLFNGVPLWVLLCIRGFPLAFSLSILAKKNAV